MGILHFLGGAAKLVGRGAAAYTTGGSSELLFSKGTQGKVFGNGKDPGLLGTAKYQPDTHPIDPNAANITGYDQTRAMLNGEANRSAHRQAATMQAARVGPASLFGGATIDTSPQEQFRQGQLGLMSQLQGQANGTGPSIAQGQLQRASDANLAQSMAMAQSMGGMGAGAGLRGISQQRAGVGQQLASDSGLLRLQEQQQAQGLLANVTAGGRGQDIGLATGQAGLFQQAGLANQGAQNQFALTQAGFNQAANQANLSSSIQQQQMNDQMVQAYLAKGMTLDEAQMQAKMQMEAMRTQQDLGVQGLKFDSYKLAGANRTGLIKSIASMVAGGAAGGAGGAAAGGAAGSSGGSANSYGGVGQTYSA